ncbi:16S rRNA processing protein RimM [hot springs metagenome]|uniref:16S rRNA processing protein RimM n=1 Tax=hot springs metagenome TaxID=433727 RepID=A0A5J4L4Q0_9ZZZZ
MSKEGESIVVIGRVMREWGLKGEMIVQPLTFDPERFLKLKDVFVQIQDIIEHKKLKSVKPYRNNILISIEECNTPEDVRRYRGALIKIKESESPKLPEGVYYHYQIVGLSVYTVDGNYLGKITSIFATGSNDVYIVNNDDREYLIPAIKDVIREIDLEARKMIVKLMEVVEE